MSSSFISGASILLNRVTRGVSQVELVYTPYDHWPLPSRSSLTARDSLRISVLDSSFNPPTLAHLALAKAPAPLFRSCNNTITNTDAGYDARLLLLSVRNVDKSLKPGDATYIQRLEMMYLLAKDMDQPSADSHEEGEGEWSSNVAIAIIDEPTFVGKSTALLTFLRNRIVLSPSTLQPHPKLAFLLGVDTLERLFSPRYYPSEESMMSSLRHFFCEEGSTVVCAKRHPSSYTSSSNELRFPEVHNSVPISVPPHALEFMDANQITIIDIGKDEQTYSSSEIRNERKGSVDTGDGNGQSHTDRWKRLVSERVAAYIEEHALYLE